MVKAEIIKDSINAQGDRITTYLLTFPRVVLAELNTHRVFSKNSASSRAIPFHKMVEMVETDPFIPIAWQKDHKGMQGTEYMIGEDADQSKVLWDVSKNEAINTAIDLHNHGTTKQLCNRLLQPFMWHTVLLTATEFDNFFKLRCPQYNFPDVNQENIFKSRKEVIQHFKDTMYFEKYWKEEASEIEWLQRNKSQAEIHIQALAEAMWDAHNESKPEFLNPGEWHIPFGDRIDADGINEVLKLEEVKYNFWDDIDEEHVELMISAARAARLSYNTFEGEIDHVKDYKLAKLLLKERHMSPFEHSAQCMSEKEYSECVKTLWCKDTYQFYQEEGWLGNFRGFKQFRQLL